MPGKPKKTPRWFPISELPLIAMLIDGPFDELEAQYASLQECRLKPYVLDDYTIGRVIKVYTEQAEDHWVFEEQLARWHQLELTPTQRQEVDRLAARAARTRELLTAILALAEELQRGTIEQVLAKDDYELGRESFLRQPPDQTGSTILTPRQLELAARIDTRVRELGLAGQDDMAIFGAMGDLMPGFKELMGTTNARGLDELCTRFNGFYLYANILEHIAAGLQSGESKVPKV